MRRRMVAVGNRWSLLLVNVRLLGLRLMGRSTYPRYQECQTFSEELAVHREWLGEVYLSLRRLSASPTNADLPGLPALRDAYSQALDLTDELIKVDARLRVLRFSFTQATGERVEAVGFQLIETLSLFRQLREERQSRLQFADQIVRCWLREVPFSRLSGLEFCVQSPLPSRRFRS